MQVARYIAPLDWRAVVTYSSVVLQLLGVVMVIPAGVALAAGEFFFAAIFGALALGAYGIGFLGSRGARPLLALKEALVVTALAYVLFAGGGALAFLPVASFVDGFFEAMSGFTTTGLSVLDVGALPKSLLFFRSYAQWIGGAGIIVLSVIVLAGPGKTAFRLYAAEFGGENLVGNVVATARIVLAIYTVLTGVGFVIFLMAGMSVFDAVLYALATISTGGFSPHAQSIGYYRSPLIQGAVIAGMILGAISFPLFYLARVEGVKRLFQDWQVRALGIVGLGGAVFLWGIHQWHLDALVASLFQAVSAVTTTGFTESDPALWPESAKLLTIVLMIGGGSVGSTAGGIKLFRVVVLARLGIWLILRQLLPGEAQLPIKYEARAISERELKEICSFFALYIATMLGGGVLLTLAGFTIGEALFESASALGTVGLSAGVTGPELAPWAKLVLIAEMWAGRLEILPALVLLYPGTWKNLRRSS